MGDWNAMLYDNKHDFVSEYGKGLLEFVPENKNQSILDLGCGTGMLTAQLSNYADTIIGVDSSASMIAKAKKQYANIQFEVCDALTLPFEKQFDVVFSNAVFHWIPDHNALLKQELLCRGWFLPPNTYDCGSFVVNGTAVVGKEQNNPYNC